MATLGFIRKMQNHCSPSFLLIFSHIIRPYPPSASSVFGFACILQCRCLRKYHKRLTTVVGWSHCTALLCIFSPSSVAASALGNDSQARLITLIHSLSSFHSVFSFIIPSLLHQGLSPPTAVSFCIHFPSVTSPLQCTDCFHMKGFIPLNVWKSGHGIWMRTCMNFHTFSPLFIDLLVSRAPVWYHSAEALSFSRHFIHSLLWTAVLIVPTKAENDSIGENIAGNDRNMAPKGPRCSY